MSRVNGVGGGIVGSVRAKAAGASGGGFAVAPDGPVEHAAPAQGAQPVGLAGMLALQEAETETFKNRNARRHGFAILDGLLELQQGLLGAAGDADAQIAGLTRLAGNMPEVADAELAPILAAIRLRARIELLRRAVDNTSGGGEMK